MAGVVGAAGTGAADAAAAFVWSGGTVTAGGAVELLEDAGGVDPVCCAWATGPARTTQIRKARIEDKRVRRIWASCGSSRCPCRCSQGGRFVPSLPRKISFCQRPNNYRGGTWRRAEMYQLVRDLSGFTVALRCALQSAAYGKCCANSFGYFRIYGGWLGGCVLSRGIEAGGLSCAL